MSYRILRRISVGGFSEVFEVEDQNSPLYKILVLKRLTPEMSARPEVRNAFETEARLLHELSHPHIVPFRRCFFDDADRVCLLMERIEGPTLEEWSRAHREQPDRVAALQSQNLRDQRQHMTEARRHLDAAVLTPSSGPSRQRAREIAIELLGEGEP